MSGKATGWVLDHSPSKGSSLLVMVCIADAANHEGRHASCSVTDLANRSRLSRRQVLRILQELTDGPDPELLVHRRGRGRSMYDVAGMQSWSTIRFDGGDKMSPPSGDNLSPDFPPDRDTAMSPPVGPDRDTAMSPRSLRKSEPRKPSGAAPRPRDAVWDQLLVEERVQEDSLTATHRKKINAAAKQIRDVLEYKPSQLERYSEIRLSLRRAARGYRAGNPGVAFTSNGLAGQWARWYVPAAAEAEIAVEPETEWRCEHGQGGIAGGCVKCTAAREHAIARIRGIGRDPEEGEDVAERRRRAQELRAREEVPHGGEDGNEDAESAASGVRGDEEVPGERVAG